MIIKEFIKKKKRHIIIRDINNMSLIIIKVSQKKLALVDLV